MSMRQNLPPMAPSDELAKGRHGMMIILFFPGNSCSTTLQLRIAEKYIQPMEGAPRMLHVAIPEGICCTKQSPTKHASAATIQYALPWLTVGLGGWLCLLPCIPNQNHLQQGAGIQQGPWALEQFNQSYGTSSLKQAASLRCAAHASVHAAHQMFWHTCLLRVILDPGHPPNFAAQTHFSLNLTWGQELFETRLAFPWLGLCKHF